MSRSFIHLRRVLLGASCVVVFGFGATEAFANAGRARSGECEPRGYQYRPMEGCYDCPRGGYCDGVGEDCVCFIWP